MKRTPSDYENSFGEEAFKRPPYVFWNVTGLVNAIWSGEDGLYLRIDEILRANRTRLRPPRSLKNAKSPNYVLRCYMIGIDKLHANPHAAIICNNEHLAREARRVVLGHGVLMERGWGEGFVRLESNVLRAMDPLGGLSVNISPPSDIMADAYSHLRISFVHTEVPESPVGVGIVVSIPGFQPRIATIGGLLEINGTNYGMTVAHVFRQDAPCESPDTSTLKLIEDDLDVFEKEAGPSSAESPDTLKLRLIEDDLDVFEKEAAASSTEPPDSIPPSQYIGNGLNSGPLKFLSGTYNKDDTVLPDLDYALVSIESSQIWRSNHLYFRRPDGSTHLILPSTIEESIPQSGAEILLATGPRGAVIGTSIESLSVLNLGNASTALYVWTLSLSSIRQGECGSWAFNLAGGELLGMLVATCPALAEAYIIPAKYIVGDIKSREWADSTRLPQDPSLALHRAVISGDIQTLDSVLSQAFDPNAGFRYAGSTLLYRAAGSGDIERVKQLIAEGVDVNEGYYSLEVSPIFEAVHYRNIEALRRLVASGYDVDKRRVEETLTPLYVAIKAGHSHVAETLVMAGANRDKIAVVESVAALHEAVKLDSLDLLHLLFTGGTDPNLKIEKFIRSAEEVEKLYPNDHVQMVLASAEKEAVEKEAAEKEAAEKEAAEKEAAEKEAAEKEAPKGGNAGERPSMGQTTDNT